ncbi:MAG: hypothetical protein K2Q13_10310 [Nitrosomonas sp.]|nr:hypothetical protein [Nitrosomonas sp.]
MPKRNEDLIIIKDHRKPRKISGVLFHSHYGQMNDKFSWIPYTDEAWQELNK